MTDISTIPLGTRLSRGWPVTPQDTVAHRGVVDLPVLATPNLIFMLEDTCVFLLQPFLDPGDLSVGTEVNVKHLGPAAPGDTVCVRVELVAVSGRRASFTVEAHCGERVLMSGTHERAVVNAQKLRQRLAGG